MKFRLAEDPFIVLSERAFIQKFRLTKVLVLNLINELRPYLEPPSRKSALSIERKVLTALRFFASGSYQQDIGENRASSVSQPSVSKCITEVCNAFNMPTIFNKYVKFPSTLNELNHLRQEFTNEYGIPGVIGIVDCTHVAIVPPQTNGPCPEHIYVNRKNYHSINVQLICDSNMGILNVNAKYPGSTHDSYIWRRSNVSSVMEKMHDEGMRSYYLLGDSGYALKPWLLTPLHNPDPSTPEGRYNEWICKTRSLIERTNGLLKMRFRCLLKHRVLHYHPIKASKIINACVVLHNICIKNNVPEPVHEVTNEVDLGMYPTEENNLNVQQVNHTLMAGRRMQRQIIENYFT
ncbi:putative nuclease HARBI1 [Daktulosphaira vitifoliae]|uniref:putative nuclease HARBI1 n=1 Tax=Daktulosphaira vitifoliae TaxID=58002 RepID=UPI0021AAA312|nr:putative nuclease HARBI1 [Daktulosphaira vitifoliae]